MNIEQFREFCLSMEGITEKMHWIQLNIDGEIPDSDICAYVRRAYDIVRAKYTKSPKK